VTDSVVTIHRPGANGEVKFTPDDGGAGLELPPEVKVRLDADGDAEVTLAPTTSGVWAYKVREYIRGGRTFFVAVPNGPGPVDLDDLDEIDPVTLGPAAELTPAWKGYVDTEDADLQAQIEALPTDAEVDADVAAEAALRAASDVAHAAALAAEEAERELEDANIVTALGGKVPVNRQINGHPLSADVTLAKSDVGLGNVDDTSDTGKPVSTLQAAAIAAAVVPYVKKPNADSWPIYIYGNSYAILAASYFTAGNHYTQQVAAALGGGAVTSYAIAGKRILDVMSSLLNATAIAGLVTAPVAGSTWPGVATRNGLVVLDSIINDIGHYPSMQANPAVPAAISTANTKYLDSMTLNYRAALALMSSASRVEQTARTASSGTWTHDSAQVYPSGGSVSFTSANGAYVEFSVTPPQSGPLRGIVFVHGFTIEAVIATMAQQTISVDGVVQTTRTPSAWERYVGPSGVNVDIGIDCFPITLPVDGNAHTIRLAHSGTAGHLMYVDAISIPSTDPNPIAVMGGEHTINYTGWTTAQKAAFHANAKVLIPVVKAVVAEFPHAFYVPSTITPNGLWSSDSLHPNDRGMTQRANDLQTGITAAARARLESRRLSNLANSNFAIV